MARYAAALFTNKPIFCLWPGKMSRFRELHRNKLLNEVNSQRNVENNTSDWCRIDLNARERRLQRQYQEERDFLEQQRLQEEIQQQKEREINEECRRKAEEMRELERQRICEAKMRQQLRETSQELRELEGQLRRAYVAKELAAQIAEKEVQKLQKQVTFSNPQGFLH